MSKKITSFWRLLLGSFITLLGFAACKTSKKAQQGAEAVVLYGAPPVEVEELKPIDTEKLYGPPPVRVDKRPIDQVKPLYAVPPVRIEREQQE